MLKHSYHEKNHMYIFFYSYMFFSYYDKTCLVCFLEYIWKKMVLDYFYYLTIIFNSYTYYKSNDVLTIFYEADI